MRTTQVNFAEGKLSGAPGGRTGRVLLEGWSRGCFFLEFGWWELIFASRRGFIPTAFCFLLAWLLPLIRTIMDRPESEPPPERRNRGKRGLLPKLAVLLVACLIGGVLGELAVRLFFKRSTYLFPRYHTGATYGDFQIRRLRPDESFKHRSVDGTWVFQTNSRGFRSDREFDYKKQDGVCRVLCLGDSTTQGLEVRQDQTYAMVLERFLKAKGMNAEVINTGVSGFGTAEELVLLEYEGMKYSPDVVVVGFFVNDPSDNLRSRLYKLEGGELVVDRRRYQPGVKVQDFIYGVPGVKWLSENSYLYSILFNTAWKIKKRSSLREGDAIERTAATEEEVTDYKADLTVALLKRIHQVCRENGAKFIIVEIPQNPTAAGPTFLTGLRDRLKESCDRLIDGEEALGDFLLSTGMHVPHGQKHINEFTHALLGVRVGNEIIALEGEKHSRSPDTP